MASLFESLTQSLTPEVMGAIGKTTGLDLIRPPKGSASSGRSLRASLPTVRQRLTA
jgi:hypothetical protein